MTAPVGAHGDRPLVGVLARSVAGFGQLQWLGLVDAARALDVDLVTFVGRELDYPFDFQGGANAVYDLVSGRRLDGLVIFTTALQTFVGEERMAAFCRRFEPLPIVSVEQAVPGHASVLLDNRGGMRAAVEHLIHEHGLRRLAFVRGPETNPGAALRYHGYVDALGAYGIDVDPSLVSPVPDWWDASHAVKAVSTLLESGAPIDAVVAASDFFARAVIAALGEDGLRVPDDIAVVGFDDVADVMHGELGLDSVVEGLAGKALARGVNLSAAPPPLTTVRTSFDDAGRRAIELLLAVLRGDPVPAEVTLSAKLIVRRSCGCLGPAVRNVLAGPSVTFPAAVSQPDQLGPALAPVWSTVTRQMQEALGGRLLAVEPDWPDRLLADYVDFVDAGVTDPFLTRLDSLMRADAQFGEPPGRWWRLVSVLRRWTGLQLRSPDTSARVEDQWLRLYAVIDEITEQRLNFAHLVSEKRDEAVRRVGQRLVTAHDTSELAAVLASELASIGIARCYLALYDPPPADGAPAPTSARLVLAYEDGRRISVDDIDDIDDFDPAELAPDPLFPTGRRNLVVLPLYFKQQQLGYVVFGGSLRLGWVYEALQGQLASAIQGGLLLERERRALAAVEEGRRRLEDRVAERTAELARMNADMRAEIAVREQAQEMQRRLEQQLLQAQKMEAIGRLAGGIAHDFNNLLLVINGYTRMMQQPGEAPERWDRELAEIAEAAERASSLTRQLVAFSRQQVLQPKLLDLNMVVDNINRMLCRLIGDEIELVAVLAPDLPMIRADVGQLEQVLVSLAVNARDAMPDGGRLTVETVGVQLTEAEAADRVGVRPGSYVAVRVTDTGTGMDDATQARIFEPFFTTKPAGRGTGLALAAVIGIVEQSGGHITVESAPGRGSSFTVHLPSADEVALEVEVEVSTVSMSGTETVLLIEDDDHVRTAIRRFLEVHGFRVLVAADGADALSLLHEYDGPLDIIVTDVKMPGLRGPQLAKRLAELRPGTPVLYISGYTDTGPVLAGIDSPEALLHKPFTAETLATRIRYLLDTPRSAS